MKNSLDTYALPECPHILCDPRLSLLNECHQHNLPTPTAMSAFAGLITLLICPFRTWKGWDDMARQSPKHKSYQAHRPYSAMGAWKETGQASCECLQLFPFHSFCHIHKLQTQTETSSQAGQSRLTPYLPSKGGGWSERQVRPSPGTLWTVRSTLGSKHGGGISWMVQIQARQSLCGSAFSGPPE